MAGEATTSLSKAAQSIYVEVYQSGTASGVGPKRTRKLILDMLSPLHIGLSLPDLQLAEMTAVNINWSDDGSESPNDLAKSSARHVLEIANVLATEPTYVTASAEGGVGICYKRNGIYADIECFNSGEIWAMISDPSSEPKAWKVENTPTKIGAAVIDINNHLTSNV